MNLGKHAGSLPEAWANFSSVPIVINVSNNLLYGELPRWTPRNVSGLGMQLQALNAANNRFSGTCHTLHTIYELLQCRDDFVGYYTTNS